MMIDEGLCCYGPQEKTHYEEERFSNLIDKEAGEMQTGRKSIMRKIDF
jgi:hypothetical protein